MYFKVGVGQWEKIAREYNLQKESPWLRAIAAAREKERSLEIVSEVERIWQQPQNSEQWQQDGGDGVLIIMLDKKYSTDRLKQARAALREKYQGIGFTRVREPHAGMSFQHFHSLSRIYPPGRSYLVSGNGWRNTQKSPLPIPRERRKH